VDSAEGDEAGEGAEEGVAHVGLGVPDVALGAEEGLGAFAAGEGDPTTR